MSAANVVFLMYHEIELPGRSLCRVEPGYVRYVVKESEFRSQMHLLLQAGWSGFSVTHAFSASRSSGLVITFDDGCETDLLAAAPILQDAGFSATFYITLGFLGRSGYLTPAQVRELSDAGFDMGCHSLTHPYLTDLDKKGLEREIAEAKDRLEHIIGRGVHHFSCPGGRWNERAVEVARKAGYLTLATSRPHTNSPVSNAFSLGRVAVVRGTTLPAFERLCHGEGLWRLALQDVLRDRVKTILGNSAYDRVRATLLHAKRPR